MDSSKLLSELQNANRYGDHRPTIVLPDGSRHTADRWTNNGELIVYVHNKQSYRAKDITDVYWWDPND